jgi:hypothetical protein
MSKEKRQAPLWLTFVASASTLLLGSGGGWLWEYKKANIEGQKEQLEELTTARDLRKNEEEQLQKILSLSNDFMAAERDYDAHQSDEVYHKFIQLNSQLAMAKDNFRALEITLAQIEHRQPRDIKITFVPPRPPTNVFVTVQ